jgi:hypothetical protein
MLRKIQDDPEVPPPEVRVYYQSLKFILLIAASQQIWEA